jgi:hypothetical protein
VLVNFFNLSTIASVGSAVSLCVFVPVAVAGFRLRSEIRAHAWPLALAILAAGFVLVFFAVDTLRNEPGTFIAMAVLIVLAVVLDPLWKWFRDRRTPAPRWGLAGPNADGPETHAMCNQRDPLAVAVQTASPILASRHPASEAAVSRHAGMDRARTGRRQ